MFNKQIVSFLLLIIAAGVLIAPAYAQSMNYTISGDILFPNETNYNNVSVSDLTITAYDMTGFAAAEANPDAKGNFTITVTSPGTYNLSVYPSEITLADLATNTSFLYQYPDNKARFQSAHVNNSTMNAVIEIVGVKTQVVTATPVVNYPATATPTATPGFGPILIIVGLIGAAAAVVYTRK